MDPRFRRASKKDSKVVVDGRFQAMFEEEAFVRPVNVDKYGRRVVSDREQQDLRRFYRLDEEAQEAEARATPEASAVASRANVETGPDADTEDSAAESSDSDESSEEGDDVVLDDALSAHPLVIRDVPEGEATRRLAMVNLDWDQIRADDIFTLLHAFKPLTGTIHRVTIYPSRFGRERMAREALEGPPRELFEPLNGRLEERDGDGESEDGSSQDELGPREENGEDFDSVALRKYQLERLRYYYAVIECDSPETATHLYRHCDGSEFEKSANFLDLRFIPDGTTFSPEEDGTPRDVCTTLPKSYRPKTDLVTAALQQSRVALTWDADDVERVRVTRRPRGLDAQDVDLAAYLASATDSDADDNALKYRDLLQGGADEASQVFGRKDQQQGEQDLQITFASALTTCPIKDGSESDENVHMEATFDAESFRTDLAHDNDKASCPQDKTQFEKYLERRKAKKELQKEASKQAKSSSTPCSKTQLKKKRAKENAEKSKENTSLALLLDDVPSDDDKDTARSARPFAKQRGKKSAVNETQGASANLHDPRFAAVYEEASFALDPSHPSFKRTVVMDQMIKERQKRRLH